MGKSVFERAIKLIKKQKMYNPSVNVSDYWFDNIGELYNIVDARWPGYSQVFSLQIRWYSEIGCECIEQIKKFINNTKLRHHIESNQLLNSSDNKEKLFLGRTIIDFNNFSFTYNNEQYNLEKFSDNFNTSRIYGNNMHDLRGINLSNWSINDCDISNCMFEYSSFANSGLCQISFSNCRFGDADFDNATLIMVYYDNVTIFNNVSIRNTFMNGFDLRNMSTPKNVQVVNYFWLIKEFFRCLFNLSRKHNEMNHTDFLVTYTKNNTNKEDIEFISYVDWYQYVTNKIYNIKSDNIADKVKFFVELVTTKYWTSSKALICFSIVVNYIYAWIYLFLDKGFAHGAITRVYDLWDYIYFSVVTFTTLGFGDITPIEHINQICVMSEVVLGYTILGIFVFLLSKKVSKLQF